MRTRTFVAASLALAVTFSLIAAREMGKGAPPVPPIRVATYQPVDDSGMSLRLAYACGALFILDSQTEEKHPELSYCADLRKRMQAENEAGYSAEYPKRQKPDD